jgi:hypothetical protein
LDNPSRHRQSRAIFILIFFINQIWLHKSNRRRGSFAPVLPFPKRCPSSRGGAFEKTIFRHRFSPPSQCVQIAYALNCAAWIRHKILVFDAICVMYGNLSDRSRRTHVQGEHFWLQTGKHVSPRRQDG